MPRPESDNPPATWVPPASRGNLPAETQALVQAYQRASKAEATVRAYRSDVRLFEAWCQRFGFQSMPASSETVAAFIVYEAEEGRAASTLGRRLAAIRYGHKLAKAPDPTDDEGVHAAIKGARRKLKVAPRQKVAVVSVNEVEIRGGVGAAIGQAA